MTVLFKINNIELVKKEVVGFAPVAQQYSQEFGAHLISIVELLNATLQTIERAKAGEDPEAIIEDLEVLLYAVRIESYAARQLLPGMWDNRPMANVMCGFLEMIDALVNSTIVTKH